MRKEILVSETVSERRIALQEDGVLTEFYVEKPDEMGMVGNIYKGKVENVLPGMQAAFVDIGQDINAFLPFSEINNPEYLKEASTSEEEDDEPRNKRHGKSSRNGKPVPQKDIEVELQKDQEILIQVIKEPFSGKGPRVTTNLAIPGHLVVLIPNANFIGISKKIWDKYEKRRLRKLIRGFLPDDVGVIVRTESEGKSDTIIKKDFDILLKQWRTLERKADSTEAPNIIFEDIETVSTVIRDLLSNDINKFLIDSRKLHRQTHNYMQNVAPEMTSRLELYRGKTPLFTHCKIDEQVSKSLRRHVWLKSGAYIIIEHTEAMVVIDVNSGRFLGKGNHEANSLKINLEAAKAVAQQLRLRDIGGLIVIDFIDLQDEANKKKVFNQLRRELKKDRAKVAVSPISEFGLLEMTRQRVRLSLRDSLSDVCPTCNGSGRILSKDAVISEIDSWIRNFRTKRRDRRLTLKLHPEMAEYLEESKKRIMRKFMWKNFVHITVASDETMGPSEYRFFSRQNGAEVTKEV
ncbi:MAG: Rne/Rng family ribonuclease [Candidatus Neomarinimicrobiota bacterium]|nr:Rne/Rng family ribonuclease [Candidatus Neomarinimicrobiota bacterium]